MSLQFGAHNKIWQNLDKILRISFVQMVFFFLSAADVFEKYCPHLDLLCNHWGNKWSHNILNVTVNMKMFYIKLTAKILYFVTKAPVRSALLRGIKYCFHNVANETQVATNKALKWSVHVTADVDEMCSPGTETGYWPHKSVSCIISSIQDAFLHSFHSGYGCVCARALKYGYNHRFHMSWRKLIRFTKNKIKGKKKTHWFLVFWHKCRFIDIMLFDSLTAVLMTSYLVACEIPFLCVCVCQARMNRNVI